MKQAPGTVRDTIIDYLSGIGTDASIGEISKAVRAQLGTVSSSSIRSYLGLNSGKVFERTGRGRYRLLEQSKASVVPLPYKAAFTVGKATMFQADCFDWLERTEPCSVQAIVTDPPYGVIEYSKREVTKLRNGRGGIWRIPPSFDGHVRSPLPRFTVLTPENLLSLHQFFMRFGRLAKRTLVPGGNVIVASNPLLSHIVMAAMADAGLEPRGYIARLTMTMRGGDRPKNAHEEFSDISVMPRSQWEPWVILRRPLEGRVQDNLRAWKTGGYRRPSEDVPFGDVIRSSPTSRREKQIAPHPSLKPQDFMRKIVRASLPLGEGIVLDPFAGAGSTLAAANAVGYKSIGVEVDPEFVRLAANAIPQLQSIGEINPTSPKLCDAISMQRSGASA